MREHFIEAYSPSNLKSIPLLPLKIFVQECGGPRIALGIREQRRQLEERVRRAFKNMKVMVDIRSFEGLGQL